MSRDRRCAEELWCIGVEHYEADNHDEAVEAYRLASEMGNAYARSNLGNILSDKNSKYFDPKEAVKLYKLAIRQGLATAAYNLSLYYRDIGKLNRFNYWESKAREMGYESIPDDDFDE